MWQKAEVCVKAINIIPWNNTYVLNPAIQPLKVGHLIYSTL